MKLVRLKEANFGTNKLYVKFTGWCLYEENKGYAAFTCHTDKYGILTPYSPVGGKKALQTILDQGGFTSLEGITFVNPF